MRGLSYRSNQKELSLFGLVFVGLLLGSSLLLRRSLLGRLCFRSCIFVFSRQLFLRNLLVGHADVSEQMVDDLFFEDRGAQVGNGIRRLAQEFVDFLFLARIATNLVVNSALQFFFRDFHACLLADFGENEAKTNATFSELAIFFASSFFGGFFVFERAASLLQVEIDLLPDVVELSVNKLLRRFELVVAIQCVEDLSLYLLAGDLAVLAFDLFANDLTQTLKRFDAELLCGFVIKNEFVRLGNFLDLDVKGSFLAGQVSGAVFSRERNVDDLLVASLEANELLFEARNELAGTENKLRVVVGAAFERLAVELAQGNRW